MFRIGKLLPEIKFGWKSVSFHMYPMTYDEFLLAKGNKQLYDILMSQNWKTIKLLRGEYIKILREYYFVGGMPEAVKRFMETNDPNQVRSVQDKILYTYQKDISKHVPTSESWSRRQRCH